MNANVVGLLPLLLLGIVPVLAQNASTSVNVDANANRHPINPNIYGINYGDAHDMATLNATLNRWGGNATTRYNWQIDAHSSAADWYFETYPDGSGTPSGSADAFVATSRAAGNGAEPMITIPMIDYLAKLGPNRSTLAGFSVAKYGVQQKTDPWNSDAGNGVKPDGTTNITGNDPLDTGTANSAAIQQAWVQHFVSTFGTASTATGIKYYILDNEPSIWRGTHRDVQPVPLGYDTLWSKIVAYATAIRAADPTAKIAGPEEWGWWAMYFSGKDQAGGTGAGSDYATHSNTYYYSWLLQQLAAYKQQTGQQLIDILTVHAYTDGPSDADDLATQLARNRQTRILWDPNFTDPYWYGDIGINGRTVNYIPTLKAWIAQYAPWLKLGFTEYNWGDEANLNGATAQADVLGIYGREGVDLATRWTEAKNTGTTPTTYYVTYLASQIYRNYDGNKSTFGDTSVTATVANPDNLSSFAAVRSSDGALTVMVINKQQGSTPVTVSLANFSTTGTAQAWQINSAAQTSISHLANVNVANNSIAVTLPSQSITLFVIPPASVVSPPAAPVANPASAITSSGFTANWTSVTGALGYQLDVSSNNTFTSFVGGFQNLDVANVTNKSVTGLAANTIYYYRIRAYNAAGPGVNSNTISPTTSSANSAPSFTGQPLSRTAVARESTTFAATAGGVPAPSYQWQREPAGSGTWSNLSDGAHYAGSGTATLSVNGTTFAMNGDQFRCVATNVAGSTTSNTATLRVQAAAGDFNADGQSDLVIQNTTTGERSVWLMNGTTHSSTTSLTMLSPDWQVAGTGDFNADGQADLIWQNTTTGDRYIWLMNGSTHVSTFYLTTLSTDWQIAGSGDFNGDGQSDLIWQNKVTGDRYIWLMNGTTHTSTVYLTTLSPAWQIAGSGDFNGDGQSDLLWQNTVTGDCYIWLMNGTTVASKVYLGTVGTQWQIGGSGDFNGDGQADLYWTNTVNGERTVWLMNGTTHASTVSLGILSRDWVLGRPITMPKLAAADFNADGNSDLVWQNTVTGDRYLWLMNGTAQASAVYLGNLAPSWQIAGTGDFNADGQSDIIWQNVNSGDRFIWLMNGTTLQANVYVGTVPPQWQIVGSGDFNGDGQTDLLWQNTVTGDRYIWLMNGTTMVSTVYLTTLSTDWQIAGTGDFNGDGQPDILWQNTVTGDRYLWLMNGTTHVSTVYLTNLSSDWQIAGTGDFNGDGQSDILWQNAVTGDRYVWLMNGTTPTTTVYLGNLSAQWLIRD